MEQSRDDFLSSDDKRAMRVESTLARILRAANDVGFMKPPLEIILIDNAAPLTGTISDDRLFLTTGLLDQCHTGDELAGILGHQVAHWCCDGEVSDRQIRLAGVPGSICRSVYLPQYE